MHTRMDTYLASNRCLTMRILREYYVKAVNGRPNSFGRATPPPKFKAMASNTKERKTRQSNKKQQLINLEMQGRMKQPKNKNNHQKEKEETYPFKLHM